MWMASATPGGAPGYDYDKEFGNNITHLAARTSQRLRVYSRQTPEVKGGRHLARFSELSGLPGIRRVGFCGSSHARGRSHRHCEPTGRREAPPDDRLREAIHGAAKEGWIASSRS